MTGIALGIIIEIDSIISISTILVKLHKLQEPVWVFSFLALLLAFLGFWFNNRSFFAPRGVFGGPVIPVSEAANQAAVDNDLSINNSVASLVSFPSSELGGGANSLPVIVDGGYNWGVLHAHNAVDIAAQCGTPIHAFAEGIVTKLGNPENWNDGYGGFVEIEHKNQSGRYYSTRYAHTEENLSTLNRYVLAGDVIALVGRTGNVHGPTGCHVHFEVRGSLNPYAK